MLKNIPRFISLITAVLSMNAFAAPAVNDSGVKIKWGYHGDVSPSNWGQLSPAFALCSTGKAQSPINIISHTNDEDNTLAINYHNDPLQIMNNGNTDLMIGKVQTIINEGHGVQVSFPKDFDKEIITFNTKEYQLVQFHMHTPSENKLEGESFPMEIHFVHQGEDGAIAVIGVLVKIGDENPELQKIIDNIPAKQGVALTIKGAKINPANLLPHEQKYFAFAGSLTTPPCTEGLQWLLMNQTIYASLEQIAKIKAASDGVNARPVQPIHDRKIVLSGA